jgi:hypothetical protein
MAFILGGSIASSYNSDPTKMPRWNASAVHTACMASGNFRNSTSSTGFWSEYFTSTVTSNSVANTARTIYTVSGKGGWLINACGACGENVASATTFVVTVDGVASTVALPTSATTYYGRGWLGAVGQYDGGSGEPHLNWKAGFCRGTAGSSGNQDNMTWDYHGTDHNSQTVVPGNLMSPFFEPQTVLRFDNSLTITVKSSAANSEAYQRYAGAIVRLDS